MPVGEVVLKKTYTLAAGQHRWNFELPLPGDLPQSLEAEGGRVSYRLKAIVERPTFVHNIIKKRPIRIVRCLMPSEFELAQSLEIHNTWSEKMIYDISLPSKIYAHGESIPVSFEIMPLATNLKVRALCGTLKEYCTYTANERSKTDTRVVRVERQVNPFANVTRQEDESWKRVIHIDVPERSPLVFCDADNDMIRIRHKLKFVISLENADGHLSELRCSVPVVVVDSYAQQTDGNQLPAYDETWRSVPYDRTVWEVLRTRAGSVSQPAAAAAVIGGESSSTSQQQTALPAPPEREPITITGRTRALSVSAQGPLSPPNGNGFPLTKAQMAQQEAAAAAEEEDEQQQTAGFQPRSVESAHSLWWNGMELSRVPSYRTAAQQEPADLSSSLPPYDSLSMSPRWTR